MNTTITVIGLIAAVLSAAGAVGAWRAASQANKASAAMVAIETQRRHVDMAPQLLVQLESATDASAILRVIIDGPDHLDRLDAVSVRIRDDISDRSQLSRNIVPSAAPEQDEAQIWGPLQFRHGSDGGSEDGRSVAPFRLEVGESRPLLMQPTTKPTGTEVSWWENQYDGEPLRVTVTCKREGFEPWVFQREVAREPSAGQQFH